MIATTVNSRKNQNSFSLISFINIFLYIVYMYVFGK